VIRLSCKNCITDTAAICLVIFDSKQSNIRQRTLKDVASISFWKKNRKLCACRGNFSFVCHVLQRNEKVGKEETQNKVKWRHIKMFLLTLHDSTIFPYCVCVCVCNSCFEKVRNKKIRGK